VNGKAFFRCLTTPGYFSSQGVFIAAILAMTVVFILDIITEAEIRPHILYVFPLAGIAL